MRPKEMMGNVLSHVASRLVERMMDVLENFIINKFTFPREVRGKLSTLKKEMMHIDAVLKAAEKSGLLDAADEFGLSCASYWKQELENAFDDMEDLLKDIGSADSCRFMKMVSNSTIYSEIIDHIEYALAEIKKCCESMKKIDDGKHGSKLSEKWTSATYSFLGAKSFVDSDRSVEKKKIVEFLLSDKEDADSLCIVGIGGLGKTELAKMVCNDDGIKQKFEVKWAHVSFRKFDLEKIVREILGEPMKDFTLETLTNKLRTELCDKTCLFVLDDVWDMGRVQWDQLKDLLLGINKGSKVLITTRYRPIADHVHADNIIRLKPSQRVCWQLIQKYAKLADLSQVTGEFKNKCEEKCEGVPLAAITLGLMIFKILQEAKKAKKTPQEIETTPQEIETTLQEFKTTLQDGNVWSLIEPREKDSNIMQSLKLSYDNLKFHVKRCFEYHAICNDDIDKERLVQMWIAQGFIQQTDEQKAFEELQCASFFSDAKEDISCQRTQFKVRRLFRDLAFLVSKDCSYIRKPNDIRALPSTTRHVHVLLSAQMQMQHVQDSELKKLRTFVGPHDIKLLSSFKRLRVLNLRLSNFEEVPVSIGDMKHLRYLEISKNQPGDKDKHINLNALIVEKCGRLRHLYVSSHRGSLEFRSLSSLQTLHLEELCNLMKLPDMSHCKALQTLGIFNCPRLCFEEKGLEDLKNLRRLALVNLPNLVNFPKVATISEGEDHSDQKLTSLCLSKCGGLTKLPEWFRNLASLERLSINDCHKLILKDSSMVNHVKEIYLNKTRFQPTSSEISDCREPTQKPEKGGENQLKLAEGEGSRCTTVPESSNIASSSLDRAKRKRKRKIDANEEHQGNSRNGISIPNDRI